MPVPVKPVVPVPVKPVVPVRDYSQSPYNIEDVNPQSIASDRNSAEQYENDKLLLARTLFGEAGAEGPEGMEAVANVIRNRVRDTNYPSTYRKVIDPAIKKKRITQFSAWNDPNSDIYKKIKDLKPGQGNPAFDSAYEIAEYTMDHANSVPYRHDTSGSLIDADHYLNRAATAKLYKSGKIPDDHWSNKAQLIGKLGKHHFYKDTTRPKSGSKYAGKSDYTQ